MKVNESVSMYFVYFMCSSTELLVVHLCGFDESAVCSALLDINTVTGIRYPSNTQVNMTDRRDRLTIQYVIHYAMQTLLFLIHN